MGGTSVCAPANAKTIFAEGVSTTKPQGRLVFTVRPAIRVRPVRPDSNKTSTPPAEKRYSPHFVLRALLRAGLSSGGGSLSVITSYRKRCARGPHNGRRAPEAPPQEGTPGGGPRTRAAESTYHGTICRVGEHTGLSPAILVSWPVCGRVKRTPWLLRWLLIEFIFAAGAQAVLPTVPAPELVVTAQTGRRSCIRAVFRGSAMGTFQGSLATHGGPQRCTVVGEGLCVGPDTLSTTTAEDLSVSPVCWIHG
jgi:hypothetical protein